MVTHLAAPTAAGFYLRYLLDVLAGLGLDMTPQVVAMGVEAAHLSDPTVRVSLNVVDQVLMQAGSRWADQSEAPLSLQLGGAVTPVALDVLAYASMSSRTLGEAITLLCQFEPYRLGFAHCTVQPHGAQTSVVLQTQGTWPSLPMQVEAALAGWVSFGRWITGPALHPVRIELAHAAQAPGAAYERFFHCPVLFERPHHAVHIDTALLDQPLAAANPDVCRLMREELQRRIDRFAKGEQFAVRLAWVIEACLASGTPSMDEVAAAMGMAPRQLRAQAQVAGTTLKAEVDAARQRLARQYLSSGMALADIAQRLGYSEQSAFNRACVRWWGISPGAARSR